MCVSVVVCVCGVVVGVPVGVCTGVLGVCVGGIVWVWAGTWVCAQMLWVCADVCRCCGHMWVLWVASRHVGVCVGVVGAQAVGVAGRCMGVVGGAQVHGCWGCIGTWVSGCMGAWMLRGTRVHGYCEGCTGARVLSH